MASVVTKPSWAQEVSARTMKLRDRLSGVDEAAQGRIADLITKAEGLKDGSPRLLTWSRIVDWWYGNRVEEAWSLLHEAELLVIDNASRSLIPILVEDAVQHAAVLDQADPARVRLINWCTQNINMDDVA
jgi:hypothetical protein